MSIQLVFMVRGMEEMLVPASKVQMYLADGWKEVERIESQAEPEPATEPTAETAEAEKPRRKSSKESRA